MQKVHRKLPRQESPWHLARRLIALMLPRQLKAHQKQAHQSQQLTTARHQSSKQEPHQLQDRMQPSQQLSSQSQHPALKSLKVCKLEKVPLKLQRLQRQRQLVPRLMAQAHHMQRKVRRKLAHHRHQHQTARQVASSQKLLQQMRLALVLLRNLRQAPHHSPQSQRLDQMLLKLLQQFQHPRASRLRPASQHRHPLPPPWQQGMPTQMLGRLLAQTVPKLQLAKPRVAALRRPQLAWAVQEPSQAGVACPSCLPGLHAVLLSPVGPL